MPKAEEVTDEVELNAQPEKAQSKASSTRHDEIAERLFADVLAKEQSQSETIEEKPTPQPENFERTLEQAQQLKKDSERLVATGEVWRALQRDDVSHKQEIDALLRALMIQVNSLRLMSNFSKQFIRLNKINHRILIKV